MEERWWYLSENFEGIPCSEEGKLQVIELLRSIEIPMKRKKDALYEWGQVCDVDISAMDYRAVTGFPDRPY